jgi:hypothetical protein
MRVGTEGVGERDFRRVDLSELGMATVLPTLGGNEGLSGVSAEHSS